MPVGLHVGISKGLQHAFSELVELGATAGQIFVTPPRNWSLSCKLTPTPRPETISFLAVHAKYLINLASPDSELRRRSLKALIAEGSFGSELGADCIVLHGGSAGKDHRPALRSVAAALKTAARELGTAIKVALENTAGAGATIGASLEELAAVLDSCSAPLYLCLDTQHLFAAGYDLRKKETVEELADRLKNLGLAERLICIHLNDSKAALGSRADRHENLGKGRIGSAGIKNFVSHPAFSKLPFIMEVPGFYDNAPLRKDIAWLKRLTEEKDTPSLRAPHLRAASKDRDSP